MIDGRRTTVKKPTPGSGAADADTDVQPPGPETAGQSPDPGGGVQPPEPVREPEDGKPLPAVTGEAVTWAVSRTRRWAARLALGRRLVAIGVSADHVTVVGILLAAVTGVVIGTGHLWTGVVLVTVGGLMDTLDGAVAKAAGTSSKRGAFFDSVSDRIADGFIFGGVAWHLIAVHRPSLALLPFAVLAVANTISYERAKAESLGYVAKGGLMERAERLILLGVGLAFNVVLVPVLWVLLGLCIVTAIQRFVKVWRQASADTPALARAAATDRFSAAAWRPARVESRWRSWREARAGMAHARLGSSISSRTRPRRTLETLPTRVRRVLTAERSAGFTVRRRSEQRQRGAAAIRRRLGTDR